MAHLGRRPSAIFLGVALALTPIAATVALAIGVAQADLYSVAEDDTLTVTAPGILGNDTPTPDPSPAPSAAPLSCVVSVTTDHLSGTLSWTPDGAFEYKPPANFNGQAASNYFTYGMAEIPGGGQCPSTAEASADVGIEVTPVNDAPTASTDSFIVLADRTLNIGAPGVLLNDHDVDGDPLSAVKDTNPAHGVLTLAADGSFSYTPATGYRGPDAFSYHASDGASSSPTRVVSLTVTAIPPIATPTPVPATPIPTPSPEPTATEEIPSASPEASPSAEPSATPTETHAPTVGPSPTPAASPLPGPAADAGGPSLPVLLVIVLFVLLVGFGAALYVPKWLREQGIGSSDDDPR